MSGTTGHHALDEARASLDAGDWHRCRELALAGLKERPDDPALLRLAGKATLELRGGDAVSYLQRAASLEPNEPDAWRDLGDALAEQGRLAEAREAFRRAVELRPDDAAARVDLAHLSYSAGLVEDAIAELRLAIERDAASVGALRNLADVYRREDRLEEALEPARRAADIGKDARAVLDLAELCLSLGRLDEAVAAFASLRAVDEEPEHEVYAYHGMIEAELRRDRWRRALDLAVDATRVDRLGRTTDVLAFIVAEVFGESDRPTPTRAEVEHALARSRAEHRRLHAEPYVV